jgi:glycosyltransferase involved in cell wall biosynthesis
MHTTQLEPDTLCLSNISTSDEPTAKRLNLAVIIPELAKYGGAERYLIECVSRWQYLHDITIYASLVNNDLLAEHGIAKKVKIAQLSPYFEGRHSILLNTALLPKIWEQEIGKHDLYHTHLWPTHMIDLHPMVWYPHEPLRILHDLRYEQPLEDVAATRQRDLHIYPKYNYDRIADVTYEAYLSSMDLVDKLGKPDRVVANSRYTAGYLEGVYGTPVRDVVYPGVNVDDFIFQPSGENIFLTIGQLWPHKRIKLIIEALKLVENAQLYIVGSGPEKEKLARIAAGMGLDNRVFFLHGLSNLEVKILFSRALAVVFMPVKEPFGIVALEAMAAGKPLIAANEGGFTEVVDESCALLVAPEPEAIAERMRYLRDNKDVARRMGAAGRQRVQAYTWDLAAKQLLEIIECTHGTWTRDHVRPRVDSTPRTTLFGAQYYCWYGNGIGSHHWNDTPHAGGVVDMPRLGYYASSSCSTIEAHWRLFDQMGLDFVILNLHIDRNGTDPYEQAAAESIFNVVDRLNTNVRLAIQICPYDCTRDKLTETLDMIRRQLVPRQSYFHYENEPVLFFFWTGVQDGNKPWINFVDDNTQGFLRIASSLRLYSAKDERRHSFGLFHGWSMYSPLELSAPANWERVWTQAYSNSGAGTRNLKILSVSPGYDDRHLRDPNRKTNPHRSVDRQQGVAYRRMLDFAFSVQDVPDMVLISTFNEYHENTHIEPSRNHASTYLDMTQKFVQEGKRRWSK